jgi:hypothetical protein
MSDPRLAPYRGALLSFAAYLVVLAASAAVLFAGKLGGGPEGVRAFYLGAPERFTSPRTLAGMLEVAIPHLVAIPLVLFAAVHVVGFARAASPRLFSLLATLSFGSALVGVLSGFAVRFLAPGIAWVKVASFVGLDLALLAWAALLVRLCLPARSPARVTGPVASPAPSATARPAAKESSP